MFSEKRWNIIGLKTVIKKVVSTGIVKRLPGSGCPQQTKMHYSRRLYLIILLTEVIIMLYNMYLASVSLWLSFLAKCETFNVLYVGRSIYLASTVNPQGQYWAGRAPPPNNSNYQYGCR